MVSPHLKRKTQELPHVSPGAQKLLKTVYNQQNREEGETEAPKVRVSELISKMAFYYEKIRNSVDYNEEYLLRKDAIERILKRQIVIESIIKASKSEEIAKHLLVELIRAGYLPNNKVPEDKIREVGRIIEKYIKLRNYSLPSLASSLNLSPSEKRTKAEKKNIEERRDLNNWILALAASEIEENLGRDEVKETVVKNLFEYLNSNIQLPENSSYRKDLKIQIYISIHRKFLKFDDDMLSFILFKYFNGEWKVAGDEEIKSIGENIDAHRQAINKQLEHPLARQIDKVVGRYSIFYSILTDMMREDPVYFYNVVSSKPEVFSDLAKKIFNKRFKQSKSKLWRAATRSIIYIFLTKSIFVIILEVPATKWLGETIDPLSLAINILFPPFLLFLAVFFTRLSNEENTSRVIEGVKEITFQEDQRSEPVYLRSPSKRGRVSNFVFGTFYSLTFLISFGAVVWILDQIGFNWVSIIIFLFFLAFVSFFAIRIRKTTREFIIVEPKENIFTFLLDFFSIPIIAVGKWLSQRFSRLNVFVFILDFIIEAPFKVFVEIAEQWTKYVKERKDDIV